ncbi:hypothetical protein B0H13DRAFT_1901119 [Mycena leptocephala]|nr:hypothetical protein B0H13DRAFT_1901119 [Mycena leptocephala]
MAVTQPRDLRRVFLSDHHHVCQLLKCESLHPHSTEGRHNIWPLKSSASRSDWLSHFIYIMKILKDAVDLVPVTYVKGALGTVVILLETVELASHQNTTAVKLKDIDLREVIVVITKLQESRGLGGQVKEFFKTRSITDKIAQYRRSIQAKCETLKCHSKLALLAPLITLLFFSYSPFHGQNKEKEIKGNVSRRASRSNFETKPPFLPLEETTRKILLLTKEQKTAKMRIGEQVGSVRSPFCKEGLTLLMSKRLPHALPAHASRGQEDE